MAMNSMNWSPFSSVFWAMGLAVIVLSTVDSPSHSDMPANIEYETWEHPIAKQIKISYNKMYLQIKVPP